MRVLTKEVPPGTSQREAVLELLKYHFGVSDVVLAHTEAGKPFLPDYPEAEISVSHCRTDVAVAIGRRGERIGVDVEEKWAQAERLAKRFSTAEELTLSNEAGLHPMWFWCTKEACFKAYSDKMRTPYEAVTVTGLTATGDLLAKVADIGAVRLRKRLLPSGAALVSLLGEKGD